MKRVYEVLFITAIIAEKNIMAPAMGSIVYIEDVIESDNILRACARFTGGAFTL